MAHVLVRALGSRSSQTDVRLVKADGTGAREVVEDGAFPLWLPEA